MTYQSTFTPQSSTRTEQEDDELIHGSIRQEVPLNRLLFPEPVTAGMNLLVVASITYAMRGTNEPIEPPIKVEPIRHEGRLLFQIHDGRHRAVAAMMAGRKTVTATLVHRLGR